jgi:hypothetical protein
VRGDGPTSWVSALLLALAPATASAAEDASTNARRGDESARVGGSGTSTPTPSALDASASTSTPTPDTLDLVAHGFDPTDEEVEATAQLFRQAARELAQREDGQDPSQFPCAEGWSRKNAKKCDKRPPLFFSKQLIEVAQVNQDFLDPWNTAAVHVVPRFGILRQSVPTGSRNDVGDFDIPDTEVRDSLVGSVEVAGTLPLSRLFSLSLTVPVGYETIDGEDATGMVGNPKLGFNFVGNLRYPKFLRCLSNGFDAVNKIGLGGALEVYLPVATDFTTSCGRAFCTPLSNMRQFRPEDLPLWTHDSFWVRARGHVDVQYAWFRAEGEFGVSPGTALSTSATMVLLDIRGLLSFRPLRRTHPLPRNPTQKPIPRWLTRLEFYTMLAAAKGYGEPNDRIFPENEGLEDLVESVSAPGTPVVADNELAPALPRITGGIRVHFEHFAPSVWVSSDFPLADGIPMIGADVAFRWTDWRVFQ